MIVLPWTVCITFKLLLWTFAATWGGQDVAQQDILISRYPRATIQRVTGYLRGLNISARIIPALLHTCETECVKVVMLKTDSWVSMSV